MNQLKGTNNLNQKNHQQIKSTQLHTFPNIQSNNVFSENDELCYELDQSTYSNISNSNKSQQNNSSNTIQMISELSDLNNNEQNEPLKYINHLQINKNSIGIKNKNKKMRNKNENFDLNEDNDENNNKYNDYITLNILNNSSSDNYIINEINSKNNNDNIDNENENENIDNEWNVPKITFSGISKVSKAISSEINEYDNDDFCTSTNNNINNINIIQENLNIKKNLKKNKNKNDNNLENNLIHKKNIESKFSTEDNYRTINLLSSQYSNMDFLKQTLNNCLIKSGYKDIIENSQKILTKSSSLDFLNEYSNFKPENEKIKKNLIMQMVLFTNMKNEMEILKKDNDDLVKKINLYKKEKILNDKIKEEIINDNNKKLNEINFLKNKIKKYKDITRNYNIIKNKLKSLIKKNDHLIKNNDKIITENKELKDELIKLKKMKKSMNDNKDKNDNNDEEKKELINKINQLLKENKNLYDIIDKKNIQINDLEKNINDQKININNYLEKISQFQDKIIQKTNNNNSKNKTQAHSQTSTYNSKISIKEESNEFNKTNNLLLLNLYDINNNIKNSNNGNNININLRQNEDNNDLNFNNNYNINYYENKILEKNNTIQKLESENIYLIHQNELNQKQIKELLNIKSEYNLIETQNNELKNKINELKEKYTNLIGENNINNKLERNNLEEQIDKLNKINKKKEEEIYTLKEESEKINKKIIFTYNTLIDLIKKSKVYVSEEFQKNNMNLFLQEFKDLIENSNNNIILEENFDEIKAMELISNFINLIPNEIEILFKKIISLQKDYDKASSIVCIKVKNNNIVNKTEKNKKMSRKGNNYSNINSDISLYKKISKYKTIENRLFFRNRPIKIKKLNITEFSNNINDSMNKIIQNSKKKLNSDIQNDEEEENKILKKCNTNLYNESINSSRSVNFKIMLNKKISPFHTIQFNKTNDNNIKIGINLKKLNFFKNNEEKKNISNNWNINNDKKNSIFKHKENISNINNKEEYFIIKRNISMKGKSNDSHIYNITKKNNTINKINNNKNSNNQKNDFKLLKNKLINNGFKIRKSMKKKIPQKMCIYQNEQKKYDNLNNNGKYLRNESSISQKTSITNNNQQTYRRKILHKSNNFSVNIKGNKKDIIYFNSSISSGNKRNNSFNIN